MIIWICTLLSQKLAVEDCVIQNHSFYINLNMPYFVGNSMSFQALHDCRQRPIYWWKLLHQHQNGREFALDAYCQRLVYSNYCHCYINCHCCVCISQNVYIHHLHTYKTQECIPVMIIVRFDWFLKTNRVCTPYKSKIVSSPLSSYSVMWSLAYYRYE